MIILTKGAAYLLRHEVYLFLVLVAGFFPVVWGLGAMLRQPPRWGRFFGVMSAVMLAGVGWLTMKYLVTPVFFEHVEPEIPELAWYHQLGHPMFLSADSPEVDNLPYGPDIYLLEGYSLELFGPSVFSSKLPGVLANAAFLVVLFFVFRRVSSAGAALLATGFSAAMFLLADSVPITGRSDSLLCLAAALGLGVATTRGRAAPIILGVLVGIAVNFKIHAFLYFMPIAVVALRHGFTVKQSLVAIVCAALVFLAPFVLAANISLPTYMLFLKAVAGQGLSLLKFQQLVWCFIVVAVPAALGWVVLREQDRAAAAATLRENGWLIGGYVLAFALIAVPASKVGAGPHHLMPWLATLPYLGLQLFPRGLRVAGAASPRARGLQALLVTWLLVGCTVSVMRIVQVDIALKVHAGEGAKVEADIESLLQEHGKDYTLLMGVGGNEDYWLTSYRCLLTFQNMPVGVDWVALMDYKRAGFATPDLGKLEQELQAEAPARAGLMWLVPKNSAPFSINTFYPPRDILFDQRFRDDFSHRYQRTGSSAFFDLYTAVGQPPARPN